MVQDPQPKTSTQKSPLDVLDEILSDSKPKAGKTTEETKANLELEQEQKLEQIKAKGAQQRQADAQRLQDQVAKLKKIKDSSEYQAPHPARPASTDQDGQQIEQLKRIKI